MAAALVIVVMSTRSREVIWGGRIVGAQIRAQSARESAQKANREADRAEAEARVWRAMVEPSPTIGQCLKGGPKLTRGGM
jgi:hypothetical protein